LISHHSLTTLASYHGSLGDDGWLSLWEEIKRLLYTLNPHPVYLSTCPFCSISFSSLTHSLPKKGPPRYLPFYLSVSCLLVGCYPYVNFNSFLPLFPRIAKKKGFLLLFCLGMGLSYPFFHLPVLTIFCFLSLFSIVSAGMGGLVFIISSFPLPLQQQKPFFPLFSFFKNSIQLIPIRFLSNFL